MINKMPVKWIVTVLALVCVFGLVAMKGNWSIAPSETIPTVPETNIPVQGWTILACGESPKPGEPPYCGSYSGEIKFPANESVKLRIIVPKADYRRELTIMNPSNYLNRQYFDVFYILGQPFAFKLVGPDGEILNFDSPLGLELVYEDHDIEEQSITESNLQFFTHNNGIWNTLKTTVDKSANTLTADISHPATIAVFEANNPVWLPFVRR